MKTLGDYEMPQGVDPERVITHSLYCGRCGYNLRYQTYVGLCSECGNPYNARPLIMQGIFMPHAMRLPFLDMLVALLCLATAYFLIRHGLNPVVAWQLYAGGFFALIGFVHVVLSIRTLGHFFRFRRVLGRIRAENG
ncbi:MAG: hypothetical protein V3W34_04465 [Phycisphaerae bacterium]